MALTTPVAPGAVPVPPRMRKFPLWLGRYPVHFTVVVRPDGTPSFKDVNRDRQLEAARGDLCHLCGDPLDAVKWFICGANGVLKNWSNDGPMHEECARYAVAACPFLANPSYAGKRTLDDLTNAGAVAALKAMGFGDGDPVARRPDQLALCTAVAYTADFRGQFPVFDVPGWESVDWDAIPARSLAADAR